MNPFRSRKKSHDAGDPRPSVDSNAPPVPSASKSSKTLKRSKKPLPEPITQQIDITTALPSSDDFRTSLIMPNLSARFSMLREQDDPSSKIGKANDDSVLFPKRASRMNLFNRNELTDIAEVDSVRSSMRPPFTPWGTNSYGSYESYGTEDDGSRGGSVMSRARPGEGNTMFGGRQKIYKINVGGSGSSRTVSGTEDGSSSKGMGGKVLYGDDVSSSAFQKLREQEKEEREMMGSVSKSPRSSKEHERPSSPSSVNYNHFRETTSSTTSAPSEARTSTAATSVASQRSMYGGHGNLNGSPPVMPLSSQASTNALSPDRQNHKSRRLYGQGLDQHIHEQQSSAMNRLESLHRQRVAGGPPVPYNLPQSRSANNLDERFQRSGQLYASNESRAATPPADVPSRLADFDLGLLEEQSLGTRSQLDSGYGRSPPTSPPVSPLQDPTLVASLEPNDIGKATASGAFNKPRKQYDEQQYLQRQLQLQQGRETPPLTRSLSPTVLSIDKKAASRSRDGSFTSTQSRSGSLKTHQGPCVDGAAVTVVVSGNPNTSINDPHIDHYHRNNGQSGAAGVSLSDVSTQPGRELEVGRNTDLVLSRYQEISEGAMGQKIPERPRDMDHPLFRTHNPTSADGPSGAPSSNDSETITPQYIARPLTDPEKPQGFDADSPTLGPVSGSNGLNGLVRAHLRNDSGQSSIYPEPSPGLNSKFPIESPTDGIPPSNERETRHYETSLHKEPWDNYRDSSNQRKAGLGFTESVTAMPPPLSIRARQILDQANALRNYESSKAKQTLGVDKVQRVLGSEAPQTSQELSNSSSWQDHLKAHHSRGGSTETEKERESWANELAERSRMIRDNFRSVIENESRSASPMPGSRPQENSPSKQGAAFGILKSKGSRGSLASRHDQPSKAMKMLGIITPNGSSRSGHDSFVADELDQSAHHVRDNRKGSLGARAAPPGLEHPSYWQHDLHRRSQEDLSRRTSPSSKASRDRSTVESPERRSISPNEWNKVESYRPAHGGGINSYHPTVPQYRKFSNAPRPAPELMESMPSHQIPPDPQSASRLRSNSRSRATNTRGYFEQRENPQISSTHNLSHSSRTTSSFHETSPSLPSIMTPVMVTTSPGHSPRLTTRRKKSINKQDISDPTFIMSTSSVGTVDLPPGASLTNGMDPPHSGQPPPVPPLNPRRKRTQTLRQALGRTEKPEKSPSVSVPEGLHYEHSNFSADDTQAAFKRRQRLRKTSSEGGNMNAKARQQAWTEPGPAVPSLQQKTMVMSNPTTPMVSHPHPGVHRSPNEMASSSGIMPGQSIVPFPHSGMQRFPNEHDVPASAVMF